MNRRLLQFLQAQDITQTQFADTLAVARGSVSHILSGRNKPGYDFLESLLLHYPELNLDWLLTGKGSMYREKTPEIAAPAPLPARSATRMLVFYDDGTFQEFLPSE